MIDDGLVEPIHRERETRAALFPCRAFLEQV
jgi:hypothetical protein